MIAEARGRNGSRIPPLVDQFGRPILSPQPERPALGESVVRRRRQVNATYDAARTTTDHSNYWANADSYDADAANSRAVRETLVKRARYEVANNGYADGIARTYATAVVGTGPKLRMQSGSTGFNQLVESLWEQWTQAVQLRRKLWCMAHAKHQDGETFGVVRTNPGIRDAVKMDFVLYETEQFQSPYLTVNQPGKIDGMEFDEYGNPTVYELLRAHPGGTWQGVQYDAERLPAEYVAHWFTMRRPGQHRGVPETSSTLNVGAASRRWREATIGAAEMAADFSVLLKTAFEPSQVAAMTPMDTTEIDKRMMTALPQGWDAYQMKAEHPASTYDMLNRALISEMSRPVSMPYNVAACDSSNYNYASGRLDHQTYHAALDLDRADCGLLVLSKIFWHWWQEAIRVYRLIGGDPSAVSPMAMRHKWDWPKHRVADVQAEAKANEIRLRTGQTTPSHIYSESGEDFEDKVQQLADDYGLSVDEMRAVLRDAIFGTTSSEPEPATVPENMAP